MTLSRPSRVSLEQVNWNIVISVVETCPFPMRNFLAEFTSVTFELEIILWNYTEDFNIDNSMFKKKSTPFGNSTKYIRNDQQVLIHVGVNNRGRMWMWTPAIYSNHIIKSVVPKQQHAPLLWRWPWQNLARTRTLTVINRVCGGNKSCGQQYINTAIHFGYALNLIGCFCSVSYSLGRNLAKCDINHVHVTQLDKTFWRLSWSLVLASDYGRRDSHQWEFNLAASDLRVDKSVDFLLIHSFQTVIAIEGGSC